MLSTAQTWNRSACFFQWKRDGFALRKCSTRSSDLQRQQLRANGFTFPLHLNNIGECRRNWIHPVTHSTEQFLSPQWRIAIRRLFKAFTGPARARDRRSKSCSYFFTLAIYFLSKIIETFVNSKASRPKCNLLCMLRCCSFYFDCWLMLFIIIVDPKYTLNADS